PFAARASGADAEGRKPRGGLFAGAAKRHACLARQGRFPDASEGRCGCDETAIGQGARRSVRSRLSLQARQYDLQTRVRQRLTKKPAGRRAFSLAVRCAGLALTAEFATASLRPLSSTAFHALRTFAAALDIPLPAAGPFHARPLRARTFSRSE